MKQRLGGFTVVELVMAMVVMAIVATALTKMFISQQRVAVAQVEIASMQANVRTGMQILTNELLELGPNASGGIDIIAGGDQPTSLTYRAMRSLGIACRWSSFSVRLRPSPIFGARPIIAGRDSLLLFVENDPDDASDDAWVSRQIDDVTASTCPDGTPAVRLGSSVGGGASCSVSSCRTPVRTFEIMELAPVVAGGHNWLGARSITGGESLTPAAGPITIDGLAFAYLDSLGNVTGTRTRIRSVRITLKGQTDWQVMPSGMGTALLPLTDDRITTITLRNVLRP